MQPSSTAPSCPGAVIALVEVRFPEGTHDTYQLVAGNTLDGFAETSVARELVQLIRAGGSAADARRRHDLLPGDRGFRRPRRRARRPRA